MFDSVRKSKRIVQIILALIILPFAFWGVESYMGFIGGSDDVARVGDSSISPAEFAQTLREQQDRLRSTLGRDFTPAMLDTPEARQALLDSMINRRLLGQQAIDYRLVVGDDELRKFISTVPALQVDGRFSKQRYDEVLRSQGMSQAGFEQRLRQDLALQQLTAAVGQSALVTRSQARSWLALEMELREVSEILIRPETFRDRVSVSEESIGSFYAENGKLFEIPEQVRVEYVVLDPDGVAGQIAVSEQDIKAWYESHSADYVQPEQRRASHILVAAAEGASADEVDRARLKAEDLLKQVKRSPNDFGAIAKQHSSDQGSAGRGGDLGFFARGAMVKPFEDAVFAMKEGQISDIVRTAFGFHVIQLTGIRPEAVRTIDEVRDDIARTVKQQLAARRISELAESFSNTVYEQSDTLQPAAEKLKLDIRRSEWIAKGQPPAGGMLANARLVEALFSEDQLKHRRNTDAIEVAPNTLVAARVIEHKPASRRALDEVREEIRKRLVTQEASRLAVEEGKAKLASLQRGEPLELAWSPVRAIRRGGDATIPSAVARDAFRLPETKLPAFVGGELPDGGYGLYKVVATGKAAAGDDAQAADALRRELARLAAEEELNLYLGALRQRHEISINPAALEAANR
jgi:peptidyl-prolyl cis-trans isomerase D